MTTCLKHHFSDYGVYSAPRYTSLHKISKTLIISVLFKSCHFIVDGTLEELLRLHKFGNFREILKQTKE